MTAKNIKTANRLFDTFIEEKKGYEFIIQGLLFELMGQILGNHRYKISDDETYKSLKRIRQLKSSLKIIREEYMNQLTLGNLAEAADMSPKYFCRFFSEMTGKTPIEYLNYYRIECAAEQLLYTDDLVTDIALNCGYNDLSYFVKTWMGSRRRGFRWSTWRIWTELVCAVKIRTRNRLHRSAMQAIPTA
mgnify:CR=1 FL=1